MYLGAPFHIVAACCHIHAEKLFVDFVVFSVVEDNVTFGAVSRPRPRHVCSRPHAQCEVKSALLSLQVRCTGTLQSKVDLTTVGHGIHSFCGDFFSHFTAAPLGRCVGALLPRVPFVKAPGPSWDPGEMAMTGLRLLLLLHSMLYIGYCPFPSRTATVNFMAPRTVAGCLLRAGGQPAQSALSGGGQVLGSSRCVCCKATTAVSHWVNVRQR